MQTHGTRHDAHEGHRLPETAERLVAAARRVLARDGFDGVTVEAVAAESGEYRDSIRYYFGSKAGLVAAVVDSLTHDQSLEAMRRTRELSPGESRIGALVDGDRRMAEDTAAFRDFFEILPHALKDEELKGRVSELYDWYRDLYVQGLASAAEGAPGACDRPGGLSATELDRIASLMAAMTDGLALQKALDPDRVDLDELFELWDRMLRLALMRSGEGTP